MIKKVLAVILVLTVVVPLAVFGVLRMDVSAETGTLGDVSYAYDAVEQTLRIYGTGAIPEHTTERSFPWYSYKSKITEIVIEEGVTGIGGYAFCGTSAKFVTIPNTVTWIGNKAFYECNDLVSVNIPGSVKQIGEYAFGSCKKMLTLTLNNGIETIGANAFRSSNGIKTVTFPPSVKTIGSYAFYNGSNGNITVTFSEGLETIGNYAFYYIRNTKLTLPDSVKTIGEKAFYEGTNLTEVVTGSELLTIGASAFSGETSAFKNLTSVDLSRSQKLESIGSEAFYQTKITEINIPDSVTTIGANAFSYCRNLVAVKLPSNLKTIGNGAFSRTAINAIEIPNGVTSIGNGAFNGCQNLKKVVVPHSVNSLTGDLLGNGVFSECTSMTALDITNKKLTLSGTVFYHCPLTHIHIPAELPVEYFAGKNSLPADESCYFRIGSDGKCPAAVCPFREGGRALGDVNGDGKINNTDIILLGRAYMAGDGNKYLSVADMNNDGRITNADIILLGRLYMTGK